MGIDRVNPMVCVNFPENIVRLEEERGLISFEVMKWVHHLPDLERPTDLQLIEFFRRKYFEIAGESCPILECSMRGKCFQLIIDSLITEDKEDFALEDPIDPFFGLGP